MNIGYVRVSTIEQNEERQIVALEKYNIDKWFVEKVSAKDTNRVQLKAMIEFAREGDVIYIHDFSRLARSTRDLFNIVETLQKNKVQLISNKENLDTNTVSGRLMLAMISAINEFERENLLERQREGIAIARQKGKYLGRKPIEKPHYWDEVIEMWRNRRIKTVEAMRRLGMKSTTFYKMLNAENEKEIILKEDEK